MKKLLSYFFLIFPLSLIAQFSGNGPLGPTNGIWYWGTNVSGVQGRGMLNTNFLYIKDRLVDTNVLAERAWVQAGFSTNTHGHASITSGNARVITYNNSGDGLVTLDVDTANGLLQFRIAGNLAAFFDGSTFTVMPGWSTELSGGLNVNGGSIYFASAPVSAAAGDSTGELVRWDEWSSSNKLFVANNNGSATNLSIVSGSAGTLAIQGWINVPNGASNLHAVNLSQLTTVSNLIDGKLDITGANAADDFVIHNMFSVDLSENTIGFGGGGSVSFANVGDVYWGSDASIRESAGGFDIYNGSQGTGNYRVHYTNGVWIFTGVAPKSEVTPTGINDLVRLQDLTNAVSSPKRETWVFHLTGVTNAATVSTSAVYWLVPYNLQITNVIAAVHPESAPTGSQMRFRVLTNGVSLLTTNLHIDATEFSSLTAATNYALSNINQTHVQGRYLRFETLQIGATLPGSGPSITVETIQVP